MEFVKQNRKIINFIVDSLVLNTLRLLIYGVHNDFVVLSVFSRGIISLKFFKSSKVEHSLSFPSGNVVDELYIVAYK